MPAAPLLRAVRVATLVASAIALFPRGGGAEEPTASSCTPERIAALAGGPIQAVHIAGGMGPNDRLVYASAASGVLVLDASSPSGLRFRGVIGPDGGTREVVKQGGRLFVAAETRGLMVYDSTVPGSEVLRGSWNSPGFAVALDVEGTTAYLADTTGGLAILDLGAGADPVPLSFLWPGGSVVDVDLSGSVAYLAAGTAGLVLADVSDPGNPFVLSSLTLPGYAYGVTVAGSRAYVTDGAGLRIVDVSAPASPVLLGSLDLPGFSTQTSLVGGYAWVASGDAGLSVVDVSFPSFPVHLTTLDTPGRALGVASNGDRTVLADLDGGVRLLDATIPSSPALGAVYRGPVAVSSVRLVGNIAYLATEDEGLFIVDTTVPESPFVVSRLPFPGKVPSVWPAGPVAWVCNLERGLAAVNVADLANPVVVGTLALPGEAWDVVATGNVLAVASGSAGLSVVDGSNPTSPRLRGRVDTPGTARGVERVGTKAIVADGPGGMAVVEMSDPDRPVVVGQFDPEGPIRSTVTVGDTVYAAGGGDGAWIVTIQRPTSPTPLGRFGTPGSASGVDVSGHLLFVADGQSGLRVGDVTEPGAPVAAGSLALPGDSVAVTLSGNFAFVGATEGGLQILDASICLLGESRPEAAFVVLNETACAGQEVFFEDRSGGKPAGWWWEFPDGTTSSVRNPSHVFPTAGNWPVTLTVSNSAGTSTRTEIVEVLDLPPAPEPQLPPAGATDLPPGDLLFSWSAPEADESDLRLFRDGSCTDPLASFFPVPGTSWTVDLLPAGEILSWTVRAANGCGIGPFAPCRTFATRPVGGFSSSPVPACAGRPVAFRDETTGRVVDRWEWDFGDGFGSTEREPTHVYARAGLYVVTMTVSGPSGSDTVTRALDVTDRPIPSFAVDGVPVPAGRPVRFLDTSLRAPNAWRWSFGDGGRSGERNPVHTFAEPGVYTVSLEATNSCGGAVVAAPVVVGLAPEAAVSGLDRPFCTGEEIRFADASSGSPTEWHWDFGDGTTVDGGAHPVHSYEDPGLYLVTLEVANAWGSSETRVDVRVLDRPEATIAVDPPRGVVGLPIRFRDRSAGAATRSWDFGDGSAPSTAVTLEHTFTRFGEYPVRLSAGNDCGDDETVLRVWADEAEVPEVRARASAPQLPAGAPLAFEDRSAGAIGDWNWDFGDGAGSDVPHPVHFFGTAGERLVRLRAAGPAGEDEREVAKVTVRPPRLALPADFFFVPTNPRAGDRIVFFADAVADPGATISWSADDGWRASGADTDHAFEAAGDHEVRMEVAGAVVRRTITVLPEDPRADFDFAPPQPTAGDRVVLRGLLPSGTTRWEWQFGDGSTALGSNPDHTWAEPGDYEVTLVASFAGGTATARRVVTIRPVPGGPAPEERRLLPAVARFDEAGGLRWETEATLSNPGPGDLPFRWRLVPMDEPAGDHPWRDALLGAGQTVTSTDLLPAGLGLPESFEGTLEVSSAPGDAPSILVAARRVAAGGIGGPSGEIPSLAESTATGSAFLLGLALDERTIASAGLRNGRSTSSAATLIVRSCGPSGREIGRATAVVPAGVSRERRLDEWIPGLAGLRPGPVVVEVLAPAGFAAWGLLVDAASGDPEVLVPDRPRTRARLVEVIRDPSDPVAPRVTDLAISNPSPSPAQVSLTLRASGTTRTAGLLLDGGETRVIEDLLGAGLFGLVSARGLVDLSVEDPLGGAGDGVLVAARTRRDEGPSGQPGFALPVLSPDDAATAGGSAAVVRAAGLARGRVRGADRSFDLLLVSLGGADATLDLVFRDSAGHPVLSRRGLVVPAGASLRLEDPLAPVAADLDGLLVEVTVVEGSAAAAASIVDPATGDRTIRLLQ